MSAMPGPGPSDAARVAAFLDVLRASTGELPISANLESRTRVIDERIAGGGLGLADKIAVFKALAPSAEEDIGHAGTGESAELRMERLLLSVAPDDLPAFKFALEYDLDYKDVEEYVFHDPPGHGAGRRGQENSATPGLTDRAIRNQSAAVAPSHLHRLR